MKKEMTGIRVDAPKIEDAIESFEEMFIRTLTEANDAAVKIAAFETLSTIASRAGAANTHVANNLINLGDRDESTEQEV